MKAIFRMTLVGAIIVAGVFFVTETVEAQVSPTVSTKYTLAQINEMYQNHKTYRPRNIYAPQEMSAKFNVDFPKARDVEWEKSNDLYEVEFEIGRVDYKAYYDMGGSLVMYKSDIYESELPAVVRNAALAKYPNFRFDDIDKIVKGQEVVYKVELEKGKLDVKLTLTHDGTILTEYVD